MAPPTSNILGTKNFFQESWNKHLAEETVKRQIAKQQAIEEAKKKENYKKPSLLNRIVSGIIVGGNSDPGSSSIQAASGFSLNSDGSLNYNPDSEAAKLAQVGLAGIGALGTIMYGGSALAPYFIPGTTGGNFIGYMAEGLAADKAANMVYKGITGSPNSYMDDAFNFIGGNNISNPYLRTGVRFGFDFLNPVFYPNFGRTIIIKASDGTIKLSKSLIPRNYILSREINKAANKFDGTVGKEYFYSPDNWYRISELPEVMGILEQGTNVTTRDLWDWPNLADNFRMFMFDNPVERGTGLNEGYYVLRPKKVENFKVFDFDSNPRLVIKSGSAHGNRSQASFGLIWNGSTSTSGGLFPKVILEGQAPYYIDYSSGNRSIFKPKLSSEVPIGSRVGFKTGEMPIEDLRYFTDLGNGRFRYDGLVLPEKRIWQTLPYYLNKFLMTPELFIKQFRDLGEIKYDLINWNFKSPLGNYLGEGSESIVFENGDRVFKVLNIPPSYINNNKTYKQFGLNELEELQTKYIDLMNRHSIFSPLTFEGTIRNKSNIYPVVSQAKLTPVTTSNNPSSEIFILEAKNKLHNELIKLGYVPENKQVDIWGGTTEGYMSPFQKFIYDLHEYNLGYDKDGNLKIFDMMIHKKGGILKAKSGIHIKEKNKGKFTASAKAAGLSVLQHAKSVLNNPNATPLQKKRANFARNTAKWKH